MANIVLFEQMGTEGENFRISVDLVHLNSISCSQKIEKNVNIKIEV